MKNSGFLMDIVELVVLGSITRMVLAIDGTEVDELERSNAEKTMKIREHIGCAMSGSARSFVERMQITSHAHQLFCGEPRPIASTMQAFYDVARNFEETGCPAF
ncbi:hypothetical protein OROMI_016182 [Orobanche minor]